MKINSVGITNLDNNKNSKTAPNFKGLMDVPGQLMNGIEKGGFATSFIIQDTLGMTVPRTGEGCQRGIDKDRIDATWNVIKARLTFKQPSEEDKQKCLKLKELNFKEGLEVGIREGLSGPVLMFTPMLVLALGKKYVGKSTFTNSSLITRLGNKFKDVVKNGTHDSVDALKKDFYKENITNIVQSTTKAVDKTAESEFIERATESLAKLDEYESTIARSHGKRKTRAQKAQKRAQDRLIADFNDFHKSHSSDLEMLNRVKIDGEVYSTEKAINGIRAYAHDATKGQAVENITEDYANSVKKSSLIKRGIVNLTAALSTIGSLSLVPMLYKLVNPVPPGALGDPTKEAAQTTKTNDNAQPKAAVVSQTNNINNIKNNNGQVSFTGKWDSLAKHLEFNGNQFTPALMTTLAVGGLMSPRCITAAKRAPEDPVTKKKDYSEIPEALTRDIVSTGAVTFGVPMLSKALISSYEGSTGFVLKNRAEGMSTAKKVLDYLNPFSSLSYYGISDLDQIYGNIDTKEKLVNMSKFVDENGGSVAKVLKSEKQTQGVFEKYGLDLKELAKQTDRKDANKTILDKLNSSKEFAEELIESIKPAKEGAANAMLKRARSLNSYVSFASTIFFVPAFLGIVLPKFVYKMTAKRQEKQAQARAQFLEQQKAQELAQAPKVDYSKLKTASSTTFTQLKH